ncbi:MAG: GNAT family N-acetyltransferase [Opitutaceae bacterium]|nr:GNAT family N-acetyltransferase [Opitutaceae bacterium]
MNFQIRTARISDKDSIESLIRESVQKLGASDYSSEQIEGALKTAWGLDTQLITDRTYFVVELNQLIVGCGGWSFRDTLFGNDRKENRRSNRIDPKTGAAKIRAFFVSPSFSRRGIASMILKKCEDEATREGFRKLELMATLPGKRRYEKHGYIAVESIHYSLGEHLSIEFIPMKKRFS